MRYLRRAAAILTLAAFVAVGAAQNQAIAFTPANWNENSRTLPTGQKQSTFYEGWSNYPTDDGWKKINNKVISVVGGFESTDVPFYFFAPPLSTGEARFESNIKFDITSKTEITDPPIVTRVTALDASPVSGQLYDMDSNGVSDSVLYPQAFPQWNADLIYYVLNDHSPKLQKVIRFNSAVPNADIKFLFDLSHDADIDVDGERWTKASKKTATKKIAFRKKGGHAARGFGLQESFIWDSNETKVKKEKISIDIQTQGQDFILTKKIRGLSNATFPVFADASLTVYPDPSVEVTTVDGRVWRAGVDETMTNIVTGAGTHVNDSGAGNPGCGCRGLVIEATANNNQYANLLRGIFLFDTSSIGAGSTVTAAVFSLYGDNTPSNGLGYSATNRVIDIVAATPASNTALAATDYPNFGTDVFGSFDPGADYSSWSTSGYNDFTITDLTSISKTSITKYGARIHADTIVNTTWVNSQATYVDYFMAETADTTSDPKLVVTYTAGSASGAPVIIILSMKPEPFLQDV